ncbi:MAG: phosphatase PAP2 family protein [Crocinitomicaceae bacterium]
MHIFKTLLPFLVITLLFLLTGVILIVITDKQLLHLSANALVGGSADVFFKYFTHVGDGITVAIIIVLFSFLKGKKFYAYLSLGLSSFAVGGLLAQFFKRLVFSDFKRPFKVFGEQSLNLIDGVTLHGSFSFPSGHSTVSFVLFIYLAFLFRRYRYVQIFCAFLAILAAYSRVHISQHFIEDILAGAALGTFTFLLMLWLHKKYFFKAAFSDELKD